MVDDVPSLTNQELWDCRERLRQAQALVATVRDAFLNDGDASGSFLLTEVVKAIDDEIRALDTRISQNQPEA